MLAVLLRGSMLSMPAPTAAKEPRALSADNFELSDFMGLVGLEGVGLISSTAGVEAGPDVSCLTEAREVFGDIAIESEGLEGSAALFRCKKSAGEFGLLVFCVSSAAGREVVLDKREDT